jgi:hypothetical protein
MQITETFRIRRYWLQPDTPADVLATLNHRWGLPQGSRYNQCPYVDINYWGAADRQLTLMELKYSEWVTLREEITYTVQGDDGL